MLCSAENYSNNITQFHLLQRAGQKNENLGPACRQAADTLSFLYQEHHYICFTQQNKSLLRERSLLLGEREKNVGLEEIHFDPWGWTVCTESTNRVQRRSEHQRWHCVDVSLCVCKQVHGCVFSLSSFFLDCNTHLLFCLLYFLKHWQLRK